MNSVKAFARFLSSAPDMLRKVRRWTHYPSLPEAERETVETHSLVSVWLAGAMLAIERKSGRHQLNDARILLAASVHDLGEGHMGDVAYAVKNHPLVREGLRKLEYEIVFDLLKVLPDTIKDVFLDAYAVEGERESLDGRFFNVIERIGYVYYAYSQVKLGRMEFLDVLERHHDPLLALSTEFESVRVLYEPFQKFVAEKIADRSRRRSLDDE